MKTYRIASAPMIHTPGVFRWIIEAIRPFDVPKATELFTALGLPDEVAASLAAKDPSVNWTIEADSVRVTVEEMKTALDIRRDFKATSTITGGIKGGNVFTCTVTLPDGETVKGLGSTLEKAEDTAWYAVKITLRESAASLT